MAKKKRSDGYRDPWVKMGDITGMFDKYGLGRRGFPRGANMTGEAEAAYRLKYGVPTGPIPGVGEKYK